MNLKDKLQKMQVLILDKLAKRSARGGLFRKKIAISFLVGLLKYLPFSRWNYVSERICESLKVGPAKGNKMTEHFFKSFLNNAFEMAGLKYLSPEALKNKVVVEGLNNLDEALSKGKGAIIASSHFGLWEFIPPWLTLNGYKTTTVVRRQNNRHVDAWFEEMRQAHGAKTTDSGFGIREILRSLKRGDILGLMVDQDNGKAGIFIKFFDKWASAPTGPAVISLKTGSPVVPLVMFPDFNGKHKLKIFKPLYPENYTSDFEGQQKLTSDYTRVMEEIIRENPHLWFWVHRRWKTQPEDAPNNPWTKLIRNVH